jgi:hypothetical protein
MARTLRPVTPLAQSILASGKPAYVVAAEVGINYNRLLDYADGRMTPTVTHVSRLSNYLSKEDETQDPSPTSAQPISTIQLIGVSANVRQVAVRRKGAFIVLELDDDSDAQNEAWRFLVGADDSILLGWRVGEKPSVCECFIEKAVKKHEGVSLQLFADHAGRCVVSNLPVGRSMDFVIGAHAREPRASGE